MRGFLRFSVRTSLLCLSIASVTAGSVACCQTSANQTAYKNPALPIAQRVDDLVGRMTLVEKVSQMQDLAAAVPRLGIPDYEWWNEGLHGVARAGHATVFPQAIGMSATWDTNLVYQEADVISTEARAKYAAAQAEGNHNIFFGLTFWSPNINIFRDPRWGRGQETYGEDPYLTGRLGVAFVTGLQGDDPKYLKVVSTPKHYDVHSGPESERHRFNVNVAPHDLEDTYLPAFRAAVTEGHADSVMCAYNSIDGEPACANTMLLQETLRHAWNFQGYVVSDCGAVGDIAHGHKYTASVEQSSVAAVRAGTDLSCGREYESLVQAVHDGLISESEIDVSVKRLMTARFRLGMFDPPADVRWANIPATENDTPEHAALALQAARESMVLLKNSNNTLPLKNSVHTIAVIGPNASSLAALEGNYNGEPSHPVTPYEGMRTYFGKRGVNILYAQGSPYTPEMMLPVPPSVYHTGETKNAAPGLKVEYFTGTDFSQPPVATGTVDSIDTDWASTAPVAQLDKATTLFSVRYSGTITPPASGDYSFHVHLADCYPCHDTEMYRVYIDGKMISDYVTQGAYQSARKDVLHVHFADAKPHTFRLDYTHAGPLSAAGAGLDFDWQPPVDTLRQQAVQAASKADVVVAFVGLSPRLEGEEMPVHIPGFSGGDRTDIVLPDVQEQLLEAVAATGKPLVVVLMNGSALAVDWAQQHASAILEAWYPGEAGGTAIAETIAGENNPAGRLPVTFYASLDQLPPFDDYSMANRTYRYFHGTPLYGFGYGLSYSSFTYSHLKLSSDSVHAGDALNVEGDVQNTSKTAGDEVAELYLAAPTSATNPVRALEGFQRIHLAAGETKHITFTLRPRQLSEVAADGARTILPGTYMLYLGGSQPEAHGNSVSTQFQITGTQALPR